MITLNDIEFTIIKSPNTRMAGTEVGVQARHLKTQIVATSIDHRSQYQNKLAAISLLEQRLAFMEK